MLTDIGAKTTDKTPDIIKEITKLVFTTATGGATRQRALTDANLKTSIVVSYDPFRFPEAGLARRALAKHDVCMLVGAEVAGGAKNCALTVVSNADLVRPAVFRHAMASETPAREPGAFHRSVSVKHVALYTRETPEASWGLRYLGTADFVDQSSLYRLPIPRAFFTTAELKAKYDPPGVLQDLEVKRPSELLSVAGTAVEVAATIFAIPLAGLQQDKALVDAQAALYNSQANYISAKQQLEELQAKALTDEQVVLVPSDAAPIRAESLLLPIGGLADDRVETFQRQIAIPLCRREMPGSAVMCADAISSD